MARRPAARRLEPADLEQRQSFVTRREQIEAQSAELERAGAQLEGAWSFWREQIIAPKYGLAAEDRIEDDGTIVRARAKRARTSSD